MTNWLILHYKLPSKPTALRVYIWRKLKRMGAILLHDSVWVVPETTRTAEQYQWLMAEVQEMGGNAYYWKATSILEEHDQSIVTKFKKQVDDMYSKLLKKMDKPGADPKEISQEYQLAASQDFFGSELGIRVREKLTSKRGEKP
ncbi:MAG TPA: Chromate resistance protein ChrB [Anaerolineales bacterium]|nr:Chromate resistance protein ChrB [Anaerolineales bacterium]